MSGGRMPNCPASASKGFSSTPVKANPRRDYRTSQDNGVLSDDEDTFSLLSPIYHDSFDSEEDLEHSPAQETSPRQSVSPVRCELPRTPSEQMEPACSPSHSAWEMWLVNKAKEERLKLEKKTEEEQLLKENQEKQHREQEQKKIVMEERIHGWLKMKREQEKNKQFLKQCKEEEEFQRQREKQKEIEQKAQQKYKDWLQKKNQRKKEMENKAKEEAVLKEEQERDRRCRAEEKFQEWLKKADEKSRASPKSPCFITGPYEKFLPSPGFYNPIPWKPIHVPPPETSVNKTSDKKNLKQRKCQQRLRHSTSAAQLQQRR
ncbi:coiled-coil domain-containing protein 34 [Labrus bergylta]|uniref:Coiled-coil domain containing 34 n=1 Tax=Labrus bergylta TaxID=56723 RepID=A0A3Q3EF48_9LABR|nr:coiled-coil domain-containing protein 34 [Labrus bergylta]XP_020497266.1 coiled-coil domain-containing protein 34 [Labrus bergylta]XP_029134694.1 coiled-coil domain-containing protein 34 [Labrus bergylta]